MFVVNVETAPEPPDEEELDEDRLLDVSVVVDDVDDEDDKEDGEDEEETCFDLGGKEDIRDIRDASVGEVDLVADLRGDRLDVCCCSISLTI